jgi:CRP/FNR family cyclic AMP-dependent transcriptional regulator
MTKLDVIQGTRIFQGLSIEQLHKLDSISREETYAAGQYIFREGDQARSLYIIEEGKVILEMRIAPLPKHRLSPQATVDVLIKGDIVGWSALVEPHIFTFSAQAVDKCRLVALDGTELLKFMDTDPVMGYEIMRRLSEVIASRLTHTRQTLISERGLALLSQAYP